MSAEEPIRHAEELEREVASLQRRLDRSLSENARLGQEIARLQKLLEEAVRKRKRNTAPFSRDNPKPNPQTPGHKSGKQYGQQATRPTPQRVDELIAAPLPPCCPHCAGPVIREDTKAQYQEDIVRVIVVRRFDVEVGVCAGCGRSVQGRHALQTPMHCTSARYRSDRKRCRWRRFGTKRWACRMSGWRGRCSWATD
jgi:hypothetical protein